MSDWDASDDEAPEQPAASTSIVTPKGRFEGEDEETDGVKDSWSDAEDEGQHGAKAAGDAVAARPVRQKGITKQKIAEKEAAERARADALAAQAALDADPAERRRREQARQLNADMDSVAGLFGATAVRSPEELLSSDPRTKQDFEAFSAQLADQLYNKHGNKALYAGFVEDLVKALCTPLKDLEVRKASSTLATLANEKQRVAREAASGKKKKGAAKPGLGSVKPSGNTGGIDTRRYDEALDDYSLDDDDFM